MYGIFSLMLAQVHYLLNNDGLTAPVVHSNNYLVLLYKRQSKQKLNLYGTNKNTQV